MAYVTYKCLQGCAFQSYLATAEHVGVHGDRRCEIPPVDVAIDCGRYVDPEGECNLRCYRQAHPSLAQSGNNIPRAIDDILGER